MVSATKCVCIAENNQTAKGECLWLFVIGSLIMRKKAIGIAIGAVAITAILCVIFALQWAKQPPVQTITVTPLEGAVSTLEYGQIYEDPGATAVYTSDGETIELAVQTISMVDVQKTGSYLVKYTAEHNGVIGTGYRRVYVIDTVAPEITLVSNPNLVITDDRPYVEEGFTAKDNYDGDITHKVKWVRTDEKIYYTVADAAGNTTTVDRWIAAADTTAPALTLLGDVDHVAPAGVEFTDPGWMVMDNRDGDISSSVVVEGEVDIFTFDTYTLTYTVTDRAGNVSTAVRNVTIVPQTAPEVILPEQKTIYLTFDDGPGPYTEELLDILKKYDVKATFFVVNTGYTHLLKRMADEGHAIGIHSTTHKFSQIYKNDQAFLDDLYTMRNIIRDITGQTTTLMRFPGGSSNTASRNYSRKIMTRLTQKVVDYGFQYFDWNVDSDDAGSADAPYQVFANVVDGVQGKQAAVVLMHDIKDYTVDAIERIINWGVANGYTFAALTPNSPGCHHPVNN